ncbi:MAG: ABC transporter substrate-binding protein [Proteobacteria bacterium]|nr:ABC transporter substrate-binding protein [Pseudomonadota bacterium]
MMTHIRNGTAVTLAALLLVSCGKSEQGSQKDQTQTPDKEKRTLVINASTSDPKPKAAMQQLIEAFKAEHPDVEVKLNLFDHESFKTSVRNFLSAKAPDVLNWFAGNRMKVFVDRNQLEDVSDLWKQGGLADSMSSALSAMTINGKQYGVPYTTYQWGIYYRKDLFEQHGLSAPKTWDELLAVCKALKDKGIVPFTIGTKFLWTAAGWFDYLNLRINGLKFHLDLMDGKESYTDDRVKAVMAKWRELIDAGYYIDNHATYSWQEALPFLQQGKAGMYLLGNFLLGNLQAGELDKYGYFPFPVINPDIGIFEDAPIDTLHIPTKAKNKDDARKFLAFAANVKQQAEMNKTLGQLPLHKDAAVKDDRFLKAGADLLRNAAGLAQFYDRDTTPDMAKIGMKGFQEFMVKPERGDAILERVDKARQRIFKK